jgi:hypothetical protein
MKIIADHSLFARNLIIERWVYTVPFSAKHVHHAIQSISHTDVLGDPYFGSLVKKLVMIDHLPSDPIRRVAVALLTGRLAFDWLKGS